LSSNNSTKAVIFSMAYKKSVHSAVPGTRRRTGGSVINSGRQFGNRRRPMVVQKQLWQDYVWKKQTVAQLAERHRRSIDWVRRQLQVAPLSHSPIMPQPLVFVADAFFHKRSFGVCVFRSPKLKRNVYWRVIATESPATYRHIRVELEQRGFSFQAIVLDGRRGVKEMFSDIPV
jgi:hypothetical protein